MLKQRINNKQEEKVLKQYNDLIFKISNKYFLCYNGQYAIEDLLQEARLATIHAYRTFDKSKNVKLITHIYNHINFRFSHYARANTGIIKIPSRVISDPNKSKPKMIDNEFLYENSDNAPFIHFNIDNLLIEQYFNLLSDKQKKILSMIYLEGYTYDEVANVFKVSRQAVNFAAIKALKLIRENYSETV